jgi:hypothetical protein
MGNIKDALYKTIGKCDNIIICDFFDFFFVHSLWSDLCKQRSSDKLFISKLKDDKIIEDFANQYDYDSSIERRKTGRDGAQKDGKEELNVEVLDKAYLLGIKNLVEDFGIILAANWMLKKGHHSTKQIVLLIAKETYDLATKGNFEVVKTNTEKFCPYPAWLKFKDYNVVIDAINKKMGTNYNMNVVFSEDRKIFGFLKE